MATSPLPPIVPEPDFADTPLDQELPLTAHLEELRGRIFVSLLAVLLFAVGGYFLSPALLKHLSSIIDSPLVFLSPTEAFLVRIKVSLLLGTLAAAPVWLFQAWRFLGVALTVGERKVLLLALPFSMLLFAAGAAFAWFGVAPAGLKFLMGFGTGYLRPMISVESALSFVLWLCLGLGLLFQLPVVLGALASWGIVTSHDLRRHRRHAVLAILVAAAVITPGPDVTSQLMLAAPTYLLFELSILISAFLQPKNS